MGENIPEDITEDITKDITEEETQPENNRSTHNSDPSRLLAEDKPEESDDSHRQEEDKKDEDSDNLTEESDPTNHYAVLGISRHADAHTIKIAYRNGILRHHPDKNKNTEKTHIFRRLQEAYDNLFN